MRTVSYRTYWGLGGGTRKKGFLYELLIDTPYTFRRYNFKDLDDRALIPSFEVIKESLEEGGGDGGMSPGATWKPITITKEEYDEIVEVLMQLNTKEAKEKHPYCPGRFILDEDLNQKSKTSKDWTRNWQLKYRGIDDMNIIHGFEPILLFYQGEHIGELIWHGQARGCKVRTRIDPACRFPFEEFSIQTELPKDYRVSKSPYFPAPTYYKTLAPHKFEVEDYFGIKRELKEIFLAGENLIFFEPKFEPVKAEIDL